MHDDLTTRQIESWPVRRLEGDEPELDGAGEALVARVAAAPTVALGVTKVLIQRGLTADLDRHLAEEGWAMELSSRSEDFKEYGRAARERRDPDDRGR